MQRWLFSHFLPILVQWTWSSAYMNNIRDKDRFCYIRCIRLFTFMHLYAMAEKITPECKISSGIGEEWIELHSSRLRVQDSHESCDGINGIETSGCIIGNTWSNSFMAFWCQEQCIWLGPPAPKRLWSTMSFLMRPWFARKKKAAGLAEMGCLISSLVSHDHYPCIKIAICINLCIPLFTVYSIFRNTHLRTCVHPKFPQPAAQQELEDEPENFGVFQLQLAVGRGCAPRFQGSVLIVDGFGDIWSDGSFIRNIIASYHHVKAHGLSASVGRSSP